MRKLSIKDAFTLARIIKKADIKEEIADFANRIAVKKTAKMKRSIPKRSALNL